VAERPRRAWQRDPSARVGVALLSPALVLLVLLLAYPLVRLLLDTLGAPGSYPEVLRSSAARRALIRTVVVSAEVSALAIVLGGVLAWEIRTALGRWKRGLLWFAVLAPFWMSIVVKNYAFVILLRHDGPIEHALRDVGLLGGGQLLYTQGAVLVGMLYAMLPYAVLPLYATFSSVDLSLIAAAESLGARRGRALASVLVPLAARGVIATATLVFVISLGFFVTPVLLGGAGAPFAATNIANDIFQYFNLTEAKALAVILLGLALLSLLVARTVTRLLPGEV
jgi:putative spermidine/putrescine transport system permease protein